MEWKRYRLANNLLGWLSFVIAAIVYLLTIGPTASLWDCAEFIVCINKLEVGHPPGAPLFMLVYNVISQFASDQSQVAIWCNATSALLSAFTIMFLYWTATALIRRVVAPKYEDQELSLAQGIVILGGGLVAALVYTFTDSFWFSAIEAEVYAFSSFCTAIVFWLMLKWADRADNPRSDRWLILIAYLMGLSIGVHLLNLLCIPAMGLIYYYRRSEKPHFWGAILALLASFGLIVVMMYGVIQGVPEIAGYFDRFAVNVLGMSFDSGILIYLIVLGGVLAWGVYETNNAVKNAGNDNRMRMSFIASVILMGIPFMGDSLIVAAILCIAVVVCTFALKSLNAKRLHTWMMCLMVIMVGYSTYGMILVRAAAHPPMNEDDPSDAFTLRAYLAREQYGSKPLFLGPTFTTQATGIEYNTTYARSKTSDGKDCYKEVKKDTPEYKYNSDDLMLFPRVFSQNPAHIRGYNIWIGRNPDDYSTPTMGDNLKFFFAYQVNYMYWRYFFWNFVGRQNDLQGDGSLLRGNAVTGIPFIDNLLIGPSEDMPDEMSNNKGHNVYYMLPLLLGILGILYQILKGKEGNQSFWVIFFLFFMTGLAIVFYVNQTAGEPRERDYSYVGSFYAFAIWIGFGVAMLADMIRKLKVSPTMAASIAVVLSLFVPLQMASQNWDDHDRSGRTAALDFGRNYLESCDPNAVLFCFGDNDTFPLWYCQEVEGIRTDVRACNLGYLGADWYVDQMKQAFYKSAPLPLEEYKESFYSHVPAVFIQPNSPMLLSEALKECFMHKPNGDIPYGVLPSDKLILVNDSVEALPHMDSLTRPYFIKDQLISLEGKKVIGRSELAILTMLNENGWKRPMHWCISSPLDAFSNLPNYVTQQGNTNQINPAYLANAPRYIDPIKSYNIFMKYFKFGGAENPKVYFDANLRNMTETYRSNVAAPLAISLMEKGEKKKAQDVLLKTFNGIRPEVVPYDKERSIGFVRALYLAGLTKQADDICKSLSSSCIKSLKWFMKLDLDLRYRVQSEGEIDKNLRCLINCYTVAKAYNSKSMDSYLPLMNQYFKAVYGHSFEELNKLQQQHVEASNLQPAQDMEDSNSN